MIPSLLAGELRRVIVEYLSTTFALSDDATRDELARFLSDPTDGIFRGPFLRVRTGFTPAPDGWQSSLDWAPEGFKPHLHQAQAFARLSTHDGHEPQPTIVTTGTGSGKTESFLVPVLDHCARARAQGQSGIKALLLYPMNALATDQARRIAEYLHTDERLAGLTAGIYIGSEGAGNTAMGPDHLIDDRATLRAAPPDILLTNYKMLDFLLLRAEDRDLWVTETGESPLRYVVLDEFHTYDGAQGTDVAMLLRRLGATTGVATPDRPLGAVCPVATSATLATGLDATTSLRDFARRVFGVAFTEDAVIGETVETVEEACGDTDYRLPIPDVHDVLALAEDDLDGLAELFTGEPAPDDPVKLGNRLRPHPLTWAILNAASNRSRTWDDVLARFVRHAPNWGITAQRAPADASEALARYLGLLSVARRDPNAPGGEPRPLFSIQVQLWVREVSRLLRRVANEPAFRWNDSAEAEPDLLPAPDTDEQREPGVADPAALLPELPSVYCRHCGRAGWMATASEVDGSLRFTTRAYQESIDNRARTRTIIKATVDEPDVRHLEPVDRDFVDTPTVTSIPVLVTPDEHAARDSTCPSCGLTEGIRFLGSRVASLASVCITELFGSGHLELQERKLLAFTDSVQDAAHRAAFFAGRTYRFNLRTELATIIGNLSGTVPGPDGGVTLADLGTALIDDAGTDPATFHQLTPPDLAAHPKVATLWTDRPSTEGRALLAKRLAFETAEELGFRHHVGRTLELTRTAAATPVLRDPDGIARIVAGIRADVAGTATLPGTVPGDEAYVRGLLERLRRRGAIFHPWLEPYVAEDGNTWRIWGGRPDGMRAFPHGQSRPVFVITGPRHRTFEALQSAPRNPTWLTDWAVRCLNVEPHDAVTVNTLTFARLAAEDVIGTRTTAKGATVYGLDPGSVLVTAIDDDRVDDCQVRCPVCLGRHTIDPDARASWIGSPCLRFRCPGTFQPAPPEPSNYYRHLYRSGFLRRVVTHEHTGLLERREREEIETAFKAGTTPTAPNLLACTPTMELGIDIGDLSAVLLTSMPPSPASYAQRVGRAGRRTGNAFVAAVLPTEPRSLYYLAEPDQMIAGEVRPPNCFLDAIEILQRQYVAFLIDRSADGTLPAPVRPRTIHDLTRHGLGADGWFTALITASQLDTTHVDAFVALFGDHLDPGTVERLHDFAAHGIELAVKEAVEAWNTDYVTLTNRRDQIKKAINKLEAEPHLEDDQQRDLDSLNGERASIIRLLGERRNEYALSALERLGLLPNYALLDDGVELRSTLWSRDENDEYQSDYRTLQRPAAVALTEFAPGNSFYVRGHRLVVDELDIGSATEPSYEWWRLCPECAFGAPEADQSSWATCPRCHLAAIADVQARHKLLRLQRVASNESEERARVYDETDERERRSYDTVVAVDVDPVDVDHAWQHTSVTFGVELATRAVIRSINFGRADHPGDKTQVAGRELSAARFATCRSCGVVAGVQRPGKTTRRDEFEHRGWCATRTSAKANPEVPVDHPALYHQISTEAVRFILPVSTFEVDERLTSFKAALLLGLRIDFGGEPDHLRVLITDHPGLGGDARRRMLVLHDTVPGGTGYLGGLADPERLRQILEGARDAIARCACRDEGRVACFRCLLGEVAPGEIDLVRRSLALEMLDDLLGTWVFDPIATVATVDIGGVEESELERRFKAALKGWAERTDDVTATVHPKPSGREEIELRIGQGPDAVRWLVTEQENLHTTPVTRPDFVITRQDAAKQQIAVYTDGFQFHASPEHLRLDDDATKRAAVRAAGLWVWSLTWADVADFQVAVESPVPKRAASRPLLTGKAATTLKNVLHAGAGGTATPSLDPAFAHANPMEQLLEFLRRPSPETWEDLATAAVAGLATAAGAPHAHSTADAAALVTAALHGHDPAITGSPVTDGAGAGASDLLRWTWRTDNDLAITALLDARASIGGPNAARWTVVSVVDDQGPAIGDDHHQARWRDWLQWANLLQFLRTDRTAVVTTTSQADAFDVGDLAIVMPTTSAPAATGTGTATSADPSPEEAETLDLVADDAVRRLVADVLGRGVSLPEVGYEVDGSPIEAAWPDERVAVLVGDEPDELRRALAEDGWVIDDAAGWDVDRLAEALGTSG